MADEIPSRFTRPMSEPVTPKADDTIDMAAVSSRFTRPMDSANVPTLPEAKSSGFFNTVRSFLDPTYGLTKESIQKTKDATWDDTKRAWGEGRLGTFGEPGKNEQAVQSLDQFAAKTNAQGSLLTVQAVKSLDFTIRALKAGYVFGQNFIGRDPKTGEISKLMADVISMPDAFAGHVPGSLSGGFHSVPKTSGGHLDVPNVPRAGDMGFIGPIREVPPNATPAEAAAITVRSPSVPVVSFENFDAYVREGTGPVSAVPLNPRPGVIVTRGGAHFNPEGPRGPTSEVSAKPNTPTGPNVTLPAKGATSKVSGLGIETSEPRGIMATPEGMTFNPEAAMGERSPVRIHIDPELHVVDAEKPVKEKVRKAVNPDVPKGATNKEFIEATEDKLGHDAVPALAEQGVKGIREGEEIRVLDHRNVERDPMTDKPNHERIPDEPAPKPEHETETRDLAGNLRTDRIGAKEDFPSFMKKAAADSNDHAAARAGDPPAEIVQAISEVTGIPPADLNKSGIFNDRLLNSDSRARLVNEALGTSLDKVGEGARAAKTVRDVPSLLAFAEHWMRHMHIQEYMAGLTAEAGRTLQAFNDFYVKFKPTEAEAATAAAKNDRIKTEAKAKMEKGMKPSAVQKLLDDEHGSVSFDFRLDSEGNIIAKTKDQMLQEWLQHQFGKDATLERLQAAADIMAPLSRAELIQYLRKEKPFTPKWWEYPLSYETTMMLSGWGTHAKYAVGNPMLNVLDGLSQILGGMATLDKGRFMGGLAQVASTAIAIPDSLITAARAVQYNWHIPLPETIAKMEKAGLVKEGVPSPMVTMAEQRGAALPWWAGGHIQQGVQRSLAGIHTFQNYLGGHAMRNNIAMERTMNEGHNPLNGSFWSRFDDIRSNLTEAEALRVEEYGQRVAHTTPPGPLVQAYNNLTSKMPILRFIDPWKLLPFNIVKNIQDFTPLAGGWYRTAENLLGKNGKDVQRVATERLSLGTAMTWWAYNLTASDSLTGSGPSDPIAKAEWLLTHKPWSVKVNGQWWSLQKFGPIAGIMGLGAQLHDTIHLVEHAYREKDPDRADKLSGEAVARTALSIGFVFDQAGLQSGAMLASFMAHPGSNLKAGEKTLYNFGTVFIPGSSFLSQTAGAMDPVLRETNSFMDAVREKIPVVREGLPARKDWLGRDVVNPRYGSAAVFQHSPADASMLAMEMQRLDIKPAPVSNNIRGVHLTPELHQEYQRVFGIVAGNRLEELVKQPGWAATPEAAQKIELSKQISNLHKQAEGVMVAKHPEIIQQHAQDVKEWMYGGTGRKSPINLFNRPGKPDGS